MQRWTATITHEVRRKRRQKEAKHLKSCLVINLKQKGSINSRLKGREFLSLTVQRKKLYRGIYITWEKNHANYYTKEWISHKNQEVEPVQINI